MLHLTVSFEVSRLNHLSYLFIIIILFVFFIRLFIYIFNYHDLFSILRFYFWDQWNKKFRQRNECVSKLANNLIQNTILWMFKKGALSESEAIFGNWKPFKNDEKYFLFRLKSSFRSRDI